MSQQEPAAKPATLEQTLKAMITRIAQLDAQVAQLHSRLLVSERVSAQTIRVFNVADQATLIENVKKALEADLAQAKEKKAAVLIPHLQERIAGLDQNIQNLRKKA